jgi:hypothetical protein
MLFEVNVRVTLVIRILQLSILSEKAFCEIRSRQGRRLSSYGAMVNRRSLQWFR